MPSGKFQASILPCMTNSSNLGDSPNQPYVNERRRPAAASSSMPLPLPPGAPTYTSRLLGWEVASYFALSLCSRCSGLPHPTKPATWLNRLVSILTQAALHVSKQSPRLPQRCHRLGCSQAPRRRSRTSRWPELVVQRDKAVCRDYLGCCWMCLQADRRKPATAKPWNLA